MNKIEDTELQEIIAKLDGGIPKSDARVRLTQYGGGPDEGKVIGNTYGYLRMGVEFLKGAFAEFEEDKKGEKTTEISVDLSYFISRESDIRFDWFERKDDLAADPAISPWKDTAVSWGILAIIVCILVLAVIGFIALVMWLK